jgi:hypothetical protein
MFILNIIIDILLWPFRTFPKLTLAILVILAFAGAGGAALIHSMFSTAYNDGCTIATGHTSCLHVKKP